MAAAETDTAPPASSFELAVLHHGTTHTFTFDVGATVTDLSSTIETALSIPPSHQKFMISKLGLLKPPFPAPDLPLSNLQGRKVQLLAPLPAELSSLKRPVTPTRPASFKPVAAYKSRPSADALKYTFLAITPLQYLPNPARSQLYLERLASDPGIKAVMLKHKFTVGLLTEMNPAEHTTHESKTLGLNRNQGEVIELRLRTDRYDGYRDYKTIRKTLCHELAHNVHGPHDRLFWDLCGTIEKEVDRADWTRGGKTLGEEEFYNPDDGGVPDGGHDGGGWTGGLSVLGGSADEHGLTRREILAKAAEARVSRERAQKDAAGGSEGNAEPS